MTDRVNDPHVQALAIALQHHRAGRLPQADAGYRQILAENPNHPDALHWRGVLATQVNRLDAAIELIRRAISIRPNVADYHCNLANALRRKGCLDEAIVCYQRALAIRPEYADAYHSLGNAWKRKGKFDEAIACYQRALSIEPDYAEAHGGLGSMFRVVARLDESIAAQRRALALKPDLTGAHGNLLITLNYHPDYTATAIYEEAQRWNQQHAAPLERFARPHDNERSPDRRIRIGYVSPDFRFHSAAYFIEGLLASHDHQQVEVFCYACSPHAADAITARLQRHAQQWHNISSLTDEQAADQIRRNRIDILVDLAGHTDNNRLLLFARKPAPVQVTYLGYPGTTGMTVMDYRLTDVYADPPSTESVHSEQLIRLPDVFACFRPQDDSPAVAPLPASTNGYITFGSFHAFPKLNDALLGWWSQVLLELPNSRLVMTARGFEDVSYRGWMIDRFAQHGIEPDRLIFKGHQAMASYLESHREVDIALDSFPWSGHTIACHALWMGVPVVTYAGPRHCSRMVASVLRAIGLPELVAQSPDDFVRVAARLARDLPRLKELRATSRQRMQASPVTDGPRFARNIEAAYRNMWRKWCMS